jgi:hypothetical protein
VSGQLHTLATKPPNKQHRYPLDEKLAGQQNVSGWFGEE